jgi:hypothetical protein
MTKLKLPNDFDGGLTGFGGDPAKNQAQHRASLKKTPIILCHGNGANSVHPKWGMETLKSFLVAAGYQDTEIWAMDYLGEDNSSPDLNDPHRNRIDQFRRFVDSVRDYLGVKKLDFVGHSLGCGMINAYLRGLQSNGRWDYSQNRLEVAGTFVALAGATYGLGRYAVSEFKTGSAFEIASHKFKDMIDDTPNGEDTKKLQKSPNPDWVEVTRLDNDQVCYVAVIAQGDFVDAQNRNTSRRKGACLNLARNLGSGLDGHEKVIKSTTIFNEFKPYLNRISLPRTITVDKASGNYSSGLQISVKVEPADAPVIYRAERITVHFEAGYISRTALETRTGNLADGESLTLASDGEWQVVFSGDGAQAVQRTYGVNVTIPEVTILTSNQAEFVRSIQVDAKSTAGTLYHSTDETHWMPGASIKLERTATVSFIAIDSSGLASPIASRPFARGLGYDDIQTSSLTEHFIAQRLAVSDYVSLGLELGFNSVITLYQVDGKWVRDPDPAIAVPAARAAAFAAAIPHAVILTADHPSGEYASGFGVTIQAASPAAGRVRVYYTTDGSDPSDEKNPNRGSFTGQRNFAIEGNGHHSVLCYAQDTSGNRKFDSFAWSIDDQQYPETSIAPSSGGAYTERVEITLHTPEPSQWTRYTTDGSDPSDSVGTKYVPGQPIVIEKSAVLKFRSKDLAGNVEPVKAARFTIEEPVIEATFVSSPQKSGYVKGDANGRGVQVGTSHNLSVGSARDGLDNRAILHFDTSSLPDNAAITHAHLEVKLHSVAGDAQAGRALIKLDVKSGYFGSSRALQAQDWGAKATAEGVAEIDQLAQGMQISSGFLEAGRSAINRAGGTQLRLRFEPSQAAPGILLAMAAEAKLVVRYTNAVTFQRATTHLLASDQELAEPVD